MVDIFDPVVTVGGVNKVERWIWMDDWRSMVPMFIPVAGTGTYPMNPLSEQIRTELLRSFSYLRGAFTDDEAKTAIKLYATTRGENQIHYNEDPPIGDELHDDCFVNKQTAVAVYVTWPTDSPTTLTCRRSRSSSRNSKRSEEQPEQQNNVLAEAAEAAAAGGGGRAAAEDVAALGALGRAAAGAAEAAASAAPLGLVDLREADQ